ncbi:flagellar biosynthetic protein FliR [Opitutus sp. ER46]|uniref:flagellar biosynthetic protein FliR n=1 Tax=Opitutus sp. ER46 TaxID=2161864 RepID=UPI000D312442|nr:flagellar biosynthetic protein FliR [Opitutus sp. ER46]PTX90910.1 type III secretion protein [Opitutus sp. ER46]
MTIDYIIVWLMVFLRSIGVILQLPVIAGHAIPVTVRLGLSVGLATLLAHLVPSVPVPLAMWPLIVAAGLEVIVGLALGFVVRITFAAIDMAGRLISTEVGMTAMPGIGVPTPASEPVAGMLSAMAIVLFFLLGGHYAVLLAFAKSFQLAPAGRAMLDPASSMVLIRSTGHMIELAVRIAAPFIAMNFLVNLAFSVLGRSVPKMNVFIVSFSARALFGLALLSTAGALVARYLYVEFGDLPYRMLQMLRAG